MIKKKRTPKPAIVIIAGFAFILILFAVPLALYFKTEGPVNPPKPQAPSITTVENPVLCLEKQVADRVGDNFKARDVEYKVLTDDQPQCDVILRKDPTETNKLVNIYNRIFILVVNNKSTYPSYVTITEDAFVQALRTQKHKGFELIWPEEANSFLNRRFGSRVNPGSSVGINVSNLTTDEVLQQTLDNHDTIGILPYDVLLAHPNKLRILNIDNNHPLHKTFSILTYPLLEMFWVEFPTNLNNKQATNIESQLNEVLSLSMVEEFDNTKVTTVANTGHSTVGAGIQNEMIEKKDDPIYPLRGISQTLQYNDIIVVNNESPITETCKIYSDKTKYLCGYPSALKMFTKTFDNDENVLIDGGGFHIYDFGKFGLLQTMVYYKEHGLPYFGIGKDSAEAHKPLIFPTANLKFAFLSYNISPVYTGYNASSGKPGNADTKNIATDIEQAREQADFVIVNIHNPVTKTHEIQSYNIRPSRSFIDVGADMVFAVNQPTIKGLEEYKGNMLFYGLGTFLASQSHNDESQTGIIVQLYFYDKKLVSYDIIPTVLSENGQVEVANADTGENIIGVVHKNSL